MVLSDALRVSVKQIITEATSLSDLTANKIREMLVSQFGRKYLDEHFEEIKRYIADVLTEDVDMNQLRNEVKAIVDSSTEQFNKYMRKTSSKKVHQRNSS